MVLKMSSRTEVCMLLILAFCQICYVSALTNGLDASALQALKSEWTRFPENWKGSDPCGTNWVGITCNNNNHIISISLGNLNLEGKLSADISSLAELQILDLTSNSKLSGSLPSNIGNLRKLTTLNLMECGFSGEIPESIGSLDQLITLSLNSNKFSGTIPASIGRLSKLNWFDIADNQIEGTIPVSNGTSSPGLDMLLETKHFHFGNNKLSGYIPEKLFSSNMTLIHVLFDGNQFTGEIPNSLSLLTNLTVLRLDRNKLTGDIPSSLNNLTRLKELYLADNRLTGSLPNLSSLKSLYTLDVSNNQLTFSLIPSWISTLGSLSTFVLKRNQLDATLDFGTNYSNQLELADNPVCREAGNQQSDFCKEIQPSTDFSVPQINCSLCGQDREPSPACRCVYPITGKFIFRSPSFSGFSNNTNFIMLQQGIEDFFRNLSYQMDSVAIRNFKETATGHQLLVDLLLFPLDKESFNQTEMNIAISAFSTHTYNPPPIFGPYIFRADQYRPFSGGSISINIGIVIGAVVGAVVLVMLLTIAGIYGLRQKKRAEKATAKWNQSTSSVEAPQLTGAKAFTFEELRKCTDNFSEANDVGGGGYGKVYKGILPSGKLLAIKRAQQGSSQGELEFKTEIELLSRVHHKNVVKLLGFCFDRSEQMLVYEYIPNGSLTDGLSGKNGIRLDWTRRLKIALGSSKGLAYLHELADPPIIHRDIKSNNILLDENLNAKVADFGLSKLVGDPEKNHVTTQVKGTMGYLDPEYYMTNQLTEKTDVYGFGVVMLELLTGKSPIVGGKYVVKEVKAKMDKSKNLYDLQELVATTIIANSENLNGFEKYVDLALRCVDGEGVNRPSMGEVVKEIENIMQLAGLNPYIDSATNSRTYEEASKGSGDPYG
ncbi:hypothetical protein YC2023_106453 [Brassica napus]